MRQRGASGERHEPRTVLPAGRLAWAFQFGFGFFVGAGVGCLLANRMGRDFENPWQVLLFIFGVGLCAGAYASFYGNRAWMAPSFLAPEEPGQSPKARGVSVTLAVLGAATAIVPVMIRLSLGGGRGQGDSSIGFKIFVLLAAGIPGYLLIRVLRTGSVVRRTGMTDREVTPLVFWAYVLLIAGTMIGMVFSALR